MKKIFYSIFILSVLSTISYASISDSTAIVFLQFSGKPWEVKQAEHPSGTYCEFINGDVVRLNMDDGKNFFWERRVNSEWATHSLFPLFSVEEKYIAPELRISPENIMKFQIITKLVSHAHIRSLKTSIHTRVYADGVLEEIGQEIVEVNFRISEEGQHLEFTEHYTKIGRERPIARRMTQHCILRKMFE